MEIAVRVVALIFMCFIILPNPIVCENPADAFIPIDINSTLSSIPRIYEEIIKMIEMANSNFTITDESLTRFLEEVPSDLFTDIPEEVIDEIVTELVSGAIESSLQDFFQDAIQVSESCLNDLTTYFQDLIQGNDYALRMLASNGKFPSLADVYNFNFQSLGDYDLCVGLENAPFRTKQCGMIMYFRQWQLRIAVCSPASCRNEDLKAITNGVVALPASFLNVTYNFGEIYYEFQCIDEVPWSGGSVATLTLLSIFTALVVIGTAHDVLEKNKLKKKKNVYEKEGRFEINHGYKGEHVNTMERKSDPELQGHHLEHVKGKGEAESQDGDDVSSEASEAAEAGTSNSKIIKSPTGKPVPLSKEMTKIKGDTGTSDVTRVFEQALLSFSAMKNGSKILDVGNGAGQLECLNGIRVLSMWWVILGHTLYFAYSRYDNIRYVYTVATDFTFLAILNATFAVDTFFVLSGLLLTYLTLNHLKKTNGRLNWFLFYFHRFWRLTPTYMMSIAILSTLFVYFGKGQGKIEFAEYSTSVCQKYWWTNLLYINNLYPFPGSLTNMCMGWSWYLANDMQFFVISPFLIILLYKNWKIGLTAIGFLCAVSFGVTAWISYYWGLPIIGSVLQPLSLAVSSLIALFVGWTMAVGTGIAVVYGIWGVYRGQTPSHEVATFYNTVSRFAWSAAVAWVIFACVNGHGGFVNTILSWAFWTPLARLSYGAYLLHPIVMYAVIYSWKTLFHFSYVDYAFFFVGSIVFAYASSFILAILIEGPFMRLEKVIFGKI
ncbi:O-acyltransferase like protein-like [Anneissia japonica]|uniref:O-acyltransferase like protein-like n=1 Tax=Anneissia japonica TaxID=1529436 RepID=UPI001425A82D|nr:O-acyltransferase like protein-like [Anneissia japonica]